MPISVSKGATHDFMYDPVFTVSSEKDYYKAVADAKISNAQFKICPVFATMFSDLPRHPKTRVLIRRLSPPPTYNEISNVGGNSVANFGRRSVDVVGADRFKYFYHCTQTENLNIETASGSHPNSEVTTENYSVSKTVSVKNKKIQTQYRESSAQTSPWQPDYILKEDSDPEILKLNFLKWGCGWPASMTEITLIERARMQREWDKTFTGLSSAEGRTREAINMEQIVFRNLEIEKVQDLRLQLLEQMLNELHEKSKYRTEQKFKNFCAMKEAEKDEKIAKLRHRTRIELRKLKMKMNHTNRPVKSIIDEYADRSSDLYAPKMRNGVNPKHFDLVIDEPLKKYDAQYIDVENIETYPSWLYKKFKINEYESMKKVTKLCIRETKWSTPILKQLYENLKETRKTTRCKYPLEQLKIIREVIQLRQPDIIYLTDDVEALYQAAVMVSSVIRGRARQMQIYDGQYRCKNLIRELRSTHVLLSRERQQKYNDRLAIKKAQRNENVVVRDMHVLQEALHHIQGNIVGSLMDFLNKELRRLLEERAIHALCFVFERERQNREAAEAGRRQAEIRRRAEHDEIFKQVIKVHQDTIDLYLKDIIMEGAELVSSDEAEEYIKKLAQKIDDDAYATLLKKQSFNEKEETVAHLVHSFVLPEVQKQIVRERLKVRQRYHLRAAHNEIYKVIDNELPPPHIIPATYKISGVFPHSANKKQERTNPDQPSTS